MHLVTWCIQSVRHVLHGGFRLSVVSYRLSTVRFSPLYGDAWLFRFLRVERAMQQTSTLAATIAISLLLIYFTVTNHIDLQPLNNLTAAGSQVPSTLMAVLPFSFVLLGLAQDRPRWVYLGWIWSMVWLALQVRQWWVPYFFGPTLLHENFAWYFQHGYTETLRILPVAVGRPTPDLQHNILQLLSLAVVLTLWTDVRERRRSH